MALLLLAPDASRAAEPLRVRASEVAASCVQAAARAWGRAAAVETAPLRDTGPVDVVVGSGVEMTRALEGGDAVINSEEYIAEIPWVLSVERGNPLKLAGLADLRRVSGEVLVLGGPAAYEARHALSTQRPGRLKESREGAVLRGAPVAVVPLSLAGTGERIAVKEIPPILTSAAVSARAAHPEAAREFVRFLASDAGQKAFASCGAAPPSP
jgi:hypothetical protein